MPRKAKRDLTIEEQLARGPIDLPFLTLVLLLLVVGLVMLLSASYPSAYYNLDSAVNTHGNPYYYFRRQAIFAVLGIAAMFVISRMNYQLWRMVSFPMLAVSVILQVTYFKLTHGKRIFRMTPIHHHFEMGGWSEVKIFTVFTGITVVMCILAFLGVRAR